MLRFFIYLYSCNTSNSFLKASRLPSIIRFSTRLAANFFLPVYFYFTRDKESNSIVNTQSSRGEKIIVSLTSFPRRIGRVWLVIESLLRQTHRPDRIVLWLSQEQFPSVDLLPARLLNQRARGLEVFLVPGDLLSHKKYFYTFRDFPTELVITVDDDIFYHPEMIKVMLDCHDRFPGNIVANYLRVVKKDKGEILPYKFWGFNKTSQLSGRDFFFGSGGGTLFPPGAFPEEVLDQEAFMRICAYADDVWLNSLSRVNSVYAVSTELAVSALLPIINFADVRLAASNIGGGNDKQMDAVRTYCIEKFSVDPFA